MNNRNHSTTIKMPRGCSVCRTAKKDALTWSNMFNEISTANNGAKMGLVGVKDGRGFFQIVGDSTVYSMMLNVNELSFFHH